MKIKVFEGKDKQWYWKVVSRNGRTLSYGSDGYTRKGSADRAAISFSTSMYEHRVPVVDELPKKLAKKAAAKKVAAKKKAVKR